MPVIIVRLALVSVSPNWPAGAIARSCLGKGMLEAIKEVVGSRVHILWQTPQGCNPLHDWNDGATNAQPR